MKSRRPSVSLGVAIIALVVAMSGTAFAATVITTKQIKDGTILPRDLSVKARNYLKGQRGPKGATGTAGATGATGAMGATGPQGPGGLPQLGTFTPTQIVDGAILTCTSPTATTCSSPQLNGLAIAATGEIATATEICAFVRGTGWFTISTAGSSTATRFTWNGTKWVATTASDGSWTSFGCL